jgi:hypothetical protein
VDNGVTGLLPQRAYNLGVDMRRPHLRLIPDARRRQRLFAAAALLVGAAVIAVLVLGIGGPGSPSPTEAATTISGATTVQRRNLVATDTESGTVGYSGAA